jgi:hypothetical protein
VQWAIGLYLAIGLIVATAMSNSQHYDHGAILFATRVFAWPLAMVRN